MPPRSPTRRRPPRSPLVRLGGHLRDALIRCFPLHLHSRSGFVVPVGDRTRLRGYERMFVEDMFPLAAHAHLVGTDAPAVLDVGAHEGLFALSVADRWPEARVHLFEPVPRLAARCRTLAQLNGLAERWTVVEAAVDAASGTGTLYRTGTALGASLIRAKAEDVGLRDAIPVRTVDLPSHAAAHNLPGFDLAKIDAEGHELPILASALPLLAGARLVFLRLFPPHSTVEQAAELLAPLGFARADGPDPARGEFLFVRATGAGA